MANRTVQGWLDGGCESLNDKTISFGRGSDLWTKIQHQEQLNDNFQNKIARLEDTVARLEDTVARHEAIFPSLKAQAMAGMQIRLRLLHKFLLEHQDLANDLKVKSQVRLVRLGNVVAYDGDARVSPSFLMNALLYHGSPVVQS